MDKSKVAHFLAHLVEDNIVAFDNICLYCILRIPCADHVINADV